VDSPTSVRLAGINMSVAGVPWLSDIDLELQSGLNVLVGPTTAGKTTLMRIVAGLDRPTSGRILVGDRDVTGVHVRERSIGFVYQQFVNYPSFTVFDNIASPLRQSTELTKAEVEARVTEVADLMKLGPFLTRLPEELSGGQQQRVAIARALVRETDVLILDEPLANLDYKLREGLRDELQRIFRERDAIVVYSTTEPTEAMLLGAHTIVMHEGRVLQAGDAITGYHRPLSAEVARVFSDPPMNVLDATRVDGSLRVDDAVLAAVPEHFPVLADGAVQLGIRPHALRLRGTRSDTTMRFAGEVALAEVTGSDTFLHVAIGGGRRIVAQLVGVHPHDTGAPVELFCDTSALFAFDADTGAIAAHPTYEAHGALDG
jgi:glycerol transport system ATP-binding protein